MVENLSISPEKSLYRFYFGKLRGDKGLLPELCSLTVPSIRGLLLLAENREQKVISKRNPAPIKPQQTTICSEETGGELFERVCYTMRGVREASSFVPEIGTADTSVKRATNEEYSQNFRAEE